MLKVLAHLSALVARKFKPTRWKLPAIRVVAVLDRVTVEIEDPLNFLAPVSNHVTCKVIDCRLRIGKDSRRKGQDLRQATFMTSPYSQFFGNKLMDYLQHFFCHRRHRKRFVDEDESLDLYVKAFYSLVNELQRLLDHDQQHDNSEIPATYIARLLGSALSSNIPIMKCETYQPSIKDVILRRLSKHENRPGYIYIFSAQVNQSHHNATRLVKVGYSEKSSYHRITVHERRCAVKLIGEPSRWEVNHAKRVEALIHAELRICGFQHRFQCRGKECDGTEHTEWYNMNTEQAKDVCEYWTDWMKRYQPYDPQGFVSSSALNMIYSMDNSFANDSKGRLWTEHLAWPSIHQLNNIDGESNISNGTTSAKSDGLSTVTESRYERLRGSADQSGMAKASNQATITDVPPEVQVFEDIEIGTRASCKQTQKLSPSPAMLSKDEEPALRASTIKDQSPAPASVTPQTRPSDSHTSSIMSIYTPELAFTVSTGGSPFSFRYRSRSGGDPDHTDQPEGMSEFSFSIPSRPKRTLTYEDDLINKKLRKCLSTTALH